MNTRLRSLAALWLLALTLPMFASGAARAESLTEARAVAEFEAIEVAGPIRLVVRQAERQALQIEADAKLMSRIETRVESRGSRPTLMIRLRDEDLPWRLGDITVRVDVVRLQALSAAGSGVIEVGALNTPALRLSIAGSSDAKLQGLTTERFEASIAGSGELRADGRARQVKLSIAGSGDADLHRLVADEVKVSIAGSGDANVSAERSLSVSIAGSGDVRYAGAASQVSSSVAGSGSVRRR